MTSVTRSIRPVPSSRHGATHRPFALVGALALLVPLALADLATAQSWTRFSDLPRAERVDLATRNARRAMRGASISNVRFGADSRALYFQSDGTWRMIDLESGDVLDADEASVPEAERAAPRQRGGGQRPARGRQATRVISPDGSITAVHRDFNVVLVRAGGEEQAVTTTGTDDLRYGTANWVYGEELDQQSAMWWSPDGTRLAFYAFDVSQVIDFPILGGLTELRPKLMTEAYPKPGEANPIAGLRIFDLESGETVTVETGDDPEAYIYRVEFSPNGDALVFSRMNRLQNTLEIVAADPASGAARVIATETQDAWVEQEPEWRWLEDGRRFILETQRNGWKQYELYDLDSGLQHVLTTGAFPASRIERVDEERGVLFYSAFDEENPLDRNLWRVDLTGANQIRMTTEPLNHGRFYIAPNGDALVCFGEAWNAAPRALLYARQGNAFQLVRTLQENVGSPLAEAGLLASELFEFTAADGGTRCFGRIHYPSNFDESRQWPILVDVYGGPETSAVNNDYRASNPMAELGFVIVQIDNRGTIDRGKAFETATYQQLGIVDLDDQAAGVKHLVATRPWADGTRVGITGHSYGGYMSMLAMLRHPDVFSVAVSGAPVTDWRNYDTIYTERYMKTPELNPVGYDAGSCVELAENLRGHLLLLHGMVDDNVHPTNAWQVVEKWQSRDIPFDMQFFPNSAHGIWSPASRSAKWSYLVEHLRAGE